MPVKLTRRTLVGSGVATATWLVSRSARPAISQSPMVQIGRTATKSVVRIRVESAIGSVPNVSIGSGVVVSTGGLVLTAKHLAPERNKVDALSIRCSAGAWAQTSTAALAHMEVVARHPTADLATMQIKDLDVMHDYNVAPLGTTPAAPFEAGTEVVVVDFEGDLPMMVSKGNIRAFDQAQNLLIIDAPINPGSSGGAVIPVETADAPRVIGIVKGATRQGLDGTVIVGIGYATPVELGSQMIVVTTEGGPSSSEKTKPESKGPPSSTGTGAIWPQFTFRSFVTPDEVQGFQPLNRLPNEFLAQYVVARRAEEGCRIKTAKLDSIDSGFEINEQKSDVGGEKAYVSCVVTARGRWAETLWQGGVTGVGLPLAMTTTQVLA